MNKKQSEELGKILVAWNRRELDSREAMRKISKLFPRIFIKAWRKLNPVKEA